MFTIRCTRKLLRYLRAKDVRDDSEVPTTRLGDWYANLLFTRRRRLIICVSELSLLPVFVDARNPSSFTSRLQTAVGTMLGRVGLLSDQVACELAEMDQPGIGPTANRSVLGSMNDFIYLARFTLNHDQPDIDTLTLSLKIADTPCGPLKYACPLSATAMLFR